MDQVDFLFRDKRQSFLKVSAIVLLGMASCVQIIQNNKFAIFLWCFKKVRDKYDFFAWK